MPAYAASIPLLQNRLPLFRFFCARLGAPDGFKTLRGWLKDVRQSCGDDGHSFFHDVLAGQAGLRLPPDKLAHYDLRIKGCVERLNTGRTPRVQLLYFQWLAALFSEWFRDRYFGDAEALRVELNHWLNDNLLVAQGVHFDPDDLAKVAFWMATGSGKTLLLHINFWQAQHYAARAGRKFDNVVLVTLNEGLSRQHLEETGQERHSDAAPWRVGRRLVRRRAAGDRDRDHQAHGEQTRGRVERGSGGRRTPYLAVPV